MPRGRKRKATTPTDFGEETLREDDMQEEPPDSENDQPKRESFQKLIDTMTKFVANTKKSSRNPIGADTIPKFDPRDEDMSSETWCRRIDESRKIFQWDELTTIHFALSKLSGLALSWYKSLQTLDYSWPEWKDQLMTAFPPQRDYYVLMERMMARRKRRDEDYVSYYYIKLSLLNQLKVSGADAVACIIGGIDDEIVKNGAKSGRHETPASLFQYLSTVTNKTATSSSYNQRPKESKQSTNYQNKRYAAKEKNDRPNRTDLTCFKCHKIGHTANKCTAPFNDNRCGKCRGLGHKAKDCTGKSDSKDKPGRQEKTIALIGEAILADPSNLKYHKDVTVNGKPTRAYIDMGSACTTITHSEVSRLQLAEDMDKTETSLLRGYGNGTVVTLGTVRLSAKVDTVEAKITAEVVPDAAQEVPMLMGRNFTELPQVGMLKDDKTLQFFCLGEEFPIVQKCKYILRVIKKTSIPPKHCGSIPVTSDGPEGDVFVEESFRPVPGGEHFIPAVLINCSVENTSTIPVENWSSATIYFKKDSILARGWSCEEDKCPLTIKKLNKTILPPLPWDKLKIGPVEDSVKKDLIDMLTQYRDCFAVSIQELGCTDNASIQIELQEEKPFAYRPYRLSPNEIKNVQQMVNELIEAGIVKESHSNYASPVILVDKKNGQKRLCIDYRKLNSLTIKDSHPLPRISEQIDRLQGGRFFTSLDLKSGYHQIPVQASSQKYTSFVTPFGQFEYTRMPFGLTNAPRVFQRYMNAMLKPVAHIAAVYLDDIVLHSSTVTDALNGLRAVLGLMRKEGLTLNFEKCHFLQSSVNYLGFEICNGQVQPGSDKIKAVEQFPAPTSVTQVRQFIGLTGYFRHFVKDYANIARPLTNLTRKDVPWKWSSTEEDAFRKLKDILISRPVLAIYDPNQVTELHTDASSLGIAGILMQYQPDGRLHPVSYYSRQTNGQEQKYHSFELETLAVVESIKKFRVYLLDLKFVVITDCNAIKASSTKMHTIPRIARWWLQLQEFNFEVKYRPGAQMRHVDALSRNPPTATVFALEKSDLILAGQMTDPKICDIKKILSKPAETDYERKVHQNYTLREERVYRTTGKRIQWYVPRGMRQQIVRTVHDDLGHFGAEKSLQRLSDNYWFPRMKDYVTKYIKCCVQCILKKKKTGKGEGFLNPIPKPKEPFDTVHVDHLGPFPKSKKGNYYILAVIDAFTKFLFIKAVKSTKTNLVLNYFDELYNVYGVPRVTITDQGSSFTAKKFKDYCKEKGTKHITIAVDTPRSNGQVERLNRSILSALTTTTLEQERWDLNVQQIQLAINTHVNQSTGRSPSELMFGYKPRIGSDVELRDELQLNTIPKVLTDLVDMRQEAWQKIVDAQARQKQYYDKKRKTAMRYKVGDIVAIEKAVHTQGSKKLAAPYTGPMMVKAVLQHDRYVISDLPGSHRTKGANYQKVIAADKMKPWSIPGGLSDETGDESGEDDVRTSESNKEQPAEVTDDGKRTARD